MRIRFALWTLLATGAVAEACAASPSQHTATSGGGVGGDSFTVGSGQQCPPRCSDDLHAVVDCNGNVLSTCPTDQLCGAGSCVAPCESAKLNKTTIGCDYYVVDPDIVAEATGSCYAAFVANTWSAPVTIHLEYDWKSADAAGFAYIPKGNGQGLVYEPLPNGELPPGEVAIVFLGAAAASFAPCPPGVNVFHVGDAAAHGTSLGDAFHITTSAPTVVYDIHPYGGGQSSATSATLLIPATAWDTNYVAVNAFRKSTVVPQAQPSIDIVAAEDGTQVTISPTAAIVAGSGVPGTGKGQPITYTLDRGKVLQITQDEELTGSVIEATKPIGLWGAATCLNIDVGIESCDSAHQQIPPVRALGHEYVAVRHRDRFDGQEESPPWRLVGAVDGTVLTWNPAPPPGAPKALEGGAVAEFRAAGPFTVKSQDSDHPFYLSAHMTSWAELDPIGNDKRGDPEFVNVIPPEQYLSSYVFFTDPTYPETNLVLVRKKTGTGFADVTLDCAGVVGGWQPVDSSGVYEYARLDLVRGNFEPQGSCDNGRHEIHSKAPFGLTVWGWGSAATGGTFGSNQNGFFSQGVSYAYPAGASVRPINAVVVPPIPK